jgi:hypothetical protein
MPNVAMKAAIDFAYKLHPDLTIEERKNYSCTRKAIIESPDNTMSIVIDGMDQNTTIVPKFRQSVKEIRSRYMKTHLCEC